MESVYKIRASANKIYAVYSRCVICCLESSEQNLDGLEWQIHLCYGSTKLVTGRYALDFYLAMHFVPRFYKYSNQVETNFKLFLKYELTPTSEINQIVKENRSFSKYTLWKDLENGELNFEIALKVDRTSRVDRITFEI